MSWEMMIRREPFTYPEFEVLGPELKVGEPPSGADRNSPDYVGWVQGSLNQIMGLRLAVDGTMGPATRSAIRSFQRQNGFPATGVVGPATERALRFVGVPDSTATIEPLPLAQPEEQEAFLGSWWPFVLGDEAGSKIARLSRPRASVLRHAIQRASLRWFCIRWPSIVATIRSVITA